MVQASNEQGIVIDRSRATYGDVKRATFAQIKIEKGAKALDLEMVQEGEREISALTEKVIVSIPADWFHKDAPAEAREMSAGWLDWVRADVIDQLRQSATASGVSAEKKG